MKFVLDIAAYTFLTFFKSCTSGWQRCGSESLRLTFINRNVFFLLAGACILQMQNAVVFELCVSPAALCAAAVV